MSKKNIITIIPQGSENNIHFQSSLSCIPTISPPEKISAIISIQSDKVPFKIDTSTDWPTVIATGGVGIGSIATAIIVACITRSNQKSQNRAIQANLRNEWIMHITQSFSEFTAAVVDIVNSINDIPNFWRTKESTKMFKELMVSRTKIICRLDPNKDESKIICDEIQLVLDLIRDHVKYNEIHKHMASIEKNITAYLEKAWCDIKTDINK